MLTTTLLILSLAAQAASTDTPKAVPAGGEDDKILYTLGFLLGRNLAPFELGPSDLKSVNAGLKDAAMQQKPQHDLSAYAPKIEEWAGKRSAKKAVGEKNRSKPFIEKMAKEKGAQVSPTGLVYIPIKEGTGASPSSTDSVKAHYEGKLMDGEKFDSSYDRGEPTDFGLNSVIRCWTEGIPKMKVGGKARLICPSDIAYGDEGRPPKIKPGAVLDFTVELVGINK